MPKQDQPAVSPSSISTPLLRGFFLCPPPGIATEVATRLSFLVITSGVKPEDESMRSWLVLAVLALASLHAVDAAAQPPPSPPAAPFQLITTDGQRIDFDPAAIVAIATATLIPAPGSV
jgi:hypothetical protein